MLKHIHCLFLLYLICGFFQAKCQPYFANKFIPTSFDAENMAVGHLNNDQLLDLIVVSFNGSLTISTNSGNGIFNAAQTITLTSNAYHVVVKDVNNDLRNDLIVFGGGSLTILTQSGTNTFPTRKIISTTNRIEHGQVVDINGDNVLDIITANSNTNTISVITGTGQGGFGASVDYISGAGPSSIAVDDLNGDGKPDIAVSNFNESNNRLSVFTNTGMGTFALTRYYSSGTSPQKVVIVDVNNDQKKDILITAFSGVQIYRNNGNAEFTSGRTVSAGEVQSYDVATGDINGDGYEDFVCPNFVDRNTGLVLNNGAGGFKTAQLLAPFGRAIKSLVADLNNDGKLDILTLSDYNNAGVAEFIQTNNVVIASNLNKDYFDPNPVFVGTITGTVNGLVSYQCAATQTSTIGAFVIYPQVDWSLNTWVATVTGKLTINKASVSVLGVNVSKFYLEPNPPFVATVLGLRNNEVVNTFTSCLATTTSNPGNYTISVTRSGDPLVNYNVTLKNGTLTIQQLPNLISGFADIPDLISFGSMYTISGVTSSANLPVGFFSSNSSVAAISSNNEIIPRNLGTATITAYSNGNTFYSSARYVQKVVRVVSVTDINVTDQVQAAYSPSAVYLPTTRQLVLSVPKAVTFAICTAIGNLWKEGEMAPGEHKIQAPAESGLYILRINQYTYRFVVE